MGSTLEVPASAANSELGEQRKEIAAGLSLGQARVAPKYFYNVLGSKLFEAICQLDEYYLTRCEAAIFEEFRPQLGEKAGNAVTLIDLGAGNCEKASRLFDVLQPRQYVPIDISAEFLHGAVAALQAQYPALPILPLGLDFSEGLALPAQVQQDRRLFFYPGSSLGNFSPLQALQFLRRLRHACGPDAALLIGIDLVKDPKRLQAAYDDALGVTAAFNRNILLHVNAILRSDFSLADWRHLALFNAGQSRIEMYLEARTAVTVRWPGGAREFAAGERIHTENSYKYTKTRFLDLLRDAGFGETTCWTDTENRFLLCHAKAI
jgi:dimethylhistidine N-methyltransferase